MSDHSPGPWAAKKMSGNSIYPSWYEIVRDTPQKIVVAGDIAGNADAQLIAAAPEMLAACKYALKNWSPNTPSNAMDALRKAIAKAEGAK